MRMLAWVNLLSPDGWATRTLHWIRIDTLFENVGLLDRGSGWLDGQASSVVIALVYGYIPFLILPLFAALDRIDQRHIEAARDLGASPFSAFRRVTLPLSMPGILAGIVLIALPMFGDYYTPDIVSGSTSTSMIGNQIDQFTRQGSEKTVGAAPDDPAVAGAARADALLPAPDAAPARRGRRRNDRRARAPRPDPAATAAGAAPAVPVRCATRGADRASCRLITAIYILWSIVPVFVAILFSFNDGRSRTTWQGFSFRWFWGDPNRASSTTRRCRTRSSTPCCWP